MLRWRRGKGGGVICVKSPPGGSSPLLLCGIVRRLYSAYPIQISTQHLPNNAIIYGIDTPPPPLPPPWTYVSTLVSTYEEALLVSDSLNAYLFRG